MNTELPAAFEAFKPEIAEQYARMIRNSFNHYVEKFGPSMRGIANSESYRFWSNTVRGNTTTEGGEIVGGRQNPHTYHINEDRLAANGKKYAEAVVAEWAGKIEAKLGELDGAEVKTMTGVAFLITGTRNGRKVTIEQQMILQSSPKGTLFNQFPARIYVDGKFTPEAKYKAAFAA